MTRLRLVTDIDAPVSRVWRALTEPGEVAAWDGAQPVDVPAGYPQAGQEALWRVSVAGLPVTLHDRVRAVERDALLQSDIAYGFVLLDETYSLAPGPGGHTRLLTLVGVDAAPAVLRPLACAVAAPSVRRAMGRLRRHCAGTT